MSPGRKPIEQKTRYDLALDHLTHHFQMNTLPLAPPLGELPADLVEIREGPGFGKQHCAVCESIISGVGPSNGVGSIDCLATGAIISYMPTPRTSVKPLGESGTSFQPTSRTTGGDLTPRP